MKKADTNTLALLDQLRVYVAENNARRASQGLQITIADDQSHSTNQAIGIMQTNALLGLLMVLLVTWIFRGSRIAILTSIGIPFTLAGTFIVLSFTGHTLNNSVLLGIVISLGMIVDDAVVVVESIYARLQKGMDQIPAAIDALREVFTPVSASVLTTMAAFLPLMLLPGVLGKFMLVIPLVVTIALCISLLEAYWMLPTHIHAFNVNFKNPSKLQRYRNRLTHNIRIQYGRILAKTLRWPRTLLSGVFLLFVLALLAVSFKLIKVDFFAMDATRILFVNVQMPEGTKLEKTMQVVTQAEQIVQQHLAPEARSILQYAGLMNTETEPLMGDHVGQIMISLNPQSDGDRNIEKLIAPLKIDLKEIPGPDQIYLFRVKDGPPASKAISLKVRGEQYSQIREVSNRLRQFMQSQAIYVEVGDNDSHGQAQMVLTPNLDAIRRAGIPPTDIMRITRLLTDGEIAARMHHAGEALEVRIKAQWPRSDDIERLLDFPIPAQDLTLIPLRALVDVQLSAANGNIRRYNFRRAITVEADIDKSLTDTVAANQKLNKYWDSIKQEYPKVDLDFSGELDDIQESLNSIVILFILGIGLIYVILGTQFNSYWQPFIILVTVPMAFTGVVAGLLLTANPLSLYTLYGVVALAGISVNAAIVMISKANQLVHQGFSLIHATVYAARRRVVPILITSLTTIAGLFGLATGLGGKSLIWGPVATAIVWGLTFSTLLTLLVVPLLYNLTMRVAQRRAMRTATLNAPVN